MRTAKNIELDLVDSKEAIAELAGIQQSMQSNKDSKVEHSREVLSRLFDDIQSLDKLTRINTGIDRLDKLTGGFRAGDLVIIGARPSVGKTSLATTLAIQYSRQDIGVLFASVEMPREQIMLRCLSYYSEVEMNKIESNRLEPFEIERVSKAYDELSKGHIYIDDTSSLTTIDLRIKIRQAKAKYPISVVIVDYLQLMKSKKRSESRYAEVSEIVRELKAIAKDNQIILIALSQLSRGVESRQDKRPQLSDLRESGDIEQTADCVMFIYRQDYQASIGAPSNRVSAEILVSKNRNGATGVIGLSYLKNACKFLE
jgi:replicative DNA helicase